MTKRDSLRNQSVIAQRIAAVRGAERVKPLANAHHVAPSQQLVDLVPRLAQVRQAAGQLLVIKHIAAELPTDFCRFRHVNIPNVQGMSNYRGHSMQESAKRQVAREASTDSDVRRPGTFGVATRLRLNRCDPAQGDVLMGWRSG